MSTMNQKERREEYARNLEAAKRWIVENSSCPAVAENCLALIQLYYFERYTRRFKAPDIEIKSAAQTNRKSKKVWTPDPSKMKRDE